LSTKFQIFVKTQKCVEGFFLCSFQKNWFCLKNKNLFSAGSFKKLDKQSALLYTVFNTVFVLLINKKLTRKLYRNRRIRVFTQQHQSKTKTNCWSNTVPESMCYHHFYQLQWSYTPTKLEGNFRNTTESFRLIKILKQNFSLHLNLYMYSCFDFKVKNITKYKMGCLSFCI